MSKKCDAQARGLERGNVMLGRGSGGPPDNARTSIKQVRPIVVNHRDRRPGSIGIGDRCAGSENN